MSNHIIHKVTVDVNTASEKEAYFIKDNISRFLQDQIFPRIEKLFEEYDSGKILRVDILDLELAIKDWKNTNEVVSKLEKELLKCLNNPDSHLSKSTGSDQASIQIHVRNNAASIFLYFLEHGYLPWYGKKEDVIQFTHPDKWEKNLEEQSFAKKIGLLLQKDGHAVKRFVYQLSTNNILSFIDSLGVLNVSGKKILITFVDKLSNNFRSVFLSYFISKTVNTESENSFFDFSEFYSSLGISGNEKEHLSIIHEFNTVIEKAFLKNIGGRIRFNPKDKTLKNSLLQKTSDIVLRANFEEIDRKGEVAHPFLKQDNDEIFVNNAGLILIHPFLKSYFENLAFLDKEGAIKEESRFVALHAFHFLVTGKDEYFESDMILEKFLCGIPLEIPIPTYSLINEYIKTEAEILLKEVIKHWPALKSTSPDGLRQMFFYRDGKLQKTDKGYKLTVECKAQDVLLDQLQWGISIVKLPWQKELLYVEW
ncbi:contractile injection system tape measure protein [Saccharicrinis sp. 156]|uniref:contractile injection system tape measure protein n=1 Tax=Saccharicrinis sp. 156 TaxID=3417574 RepID=UPI003D32AB3C